MKVDFVVDELGKDRWRDSRHHLIALRRLGSGRQIEGQLTRLTYFLPRAESRLGQRGHDVLKKLHLRLLTLSGEPAEEVHHATRIV